MSDDDKNWHDEFVRKAMAEASKDVCDATEGSPEPPPQVVMLSSRGLHTIVVKADLGGFSLWAVSEAGSPDGPGEWLTEKIGWLDWEAVDLLIQARSAVNALRPAPPSDS